MKKILLISCLIATTVFPLSAQKVGLVLSGGGAKGITHVGIIKALEENNIPIDYVTGTSMGAIVGGLYAMGMSPDEIITLLKSNDFKHWSTGEIESEYIYYYRNADPKPKFADINLKLRKKDFWGKNDFQDIKQILLPTNLVPPHQMNFAFVSLFAQANAVADGDFNKLFIPFRCVASDIYKKEPVVCRYGELGDAIRASMTFPFVFKPIVIDSCLLFDGGIYNNFPVDVMKTDFNPDFVIGSAVANNPRKPDKNDIVMQVENMIMSHTDYSLQNTEGVMLKFNLNNVKIFDFSNVDQLVQLGYDSTMKHIDEIKSKVKRRLTPEELTQKRQEFKSRFPELRFQTISVEGVDSLQKKYVEQQFHHKNEIFNLREFKEAYFKLISDDKIMEVMPHAKFNSPRGNFDLKLQVKTRDDLKVSIGGNVSSSTSNQAYFGVSYQNLKEISQMAYADAQFGKMYNGLGLGSRIEIPGHQNWYMKLALVLHKFDYYEGDRIFYVDNRTSNFNQYEAYTKLSVGLPVTMKGRFEFGLGYGALTDNYLQNTPIYSSTKVDKSIFSLGSIFSRIESYTLNNVMYPTEGSNYSAAAQLVCGEESFRSANNPKTNKYKETAFWVQFRGKYDRYRTLSSKLTLGTYAELGLSSRKMLQNYTTTIIQSMSFRPTPHSKTIFNPGFSANQFAAIGLKPIYNFNQQFHARAEAYWFIPYQDINKTPENTARYSTPFHSSHFLAETSLVFNFRIASAGLFANYYSTGPSKFNFGVNIGFLLFNQKFLE